MSLEIIDMREALEKWKKDYQSGIRATVELLQTYRSRGYIVKYKDARLWKLKHPALNRPIYKRLSPLRKQKIASLSFLAPARLEIVTADQKLADITKTYMEEHKDQEQLLDIKIRLSNIF